MFMKQIRSKPRTATVQEDENGDLFIELTPEELDHLKVKENDIINLEVQENGTIITKA